jgi:hypothetical protein
MTYKSSIVHGFAGGLSELNQILKILLQDMEKYKGLSKKKALQF